MGLAVFAAGLVAALTAGSELSQTLAGPGADEPLWMMIGGGAAAGLGLLARIGHSRQHGSR
ncbi:MAG TPA: hypothetical protein VFD43_03235 [Planctomycetota bacterium]|nr:hypothetical protein [Planctomycetota bacterium]